MNRLSHYKHHITSRHATYGVMIAIVALIVFALWSSQSGTALLQLFKNIVQPFSSLAPVIYILFYIILGLVGFSTSVMSFGAIVLFNPLIAFLCIMIGATMSAFLAFTFTRSSKIQLAFPVVKSLSARRSVVCFKAD
jgi:uncharacterized membrane protein YdjX (TVP38/TMEM64 family)